MPKHLFLTSILIGLLKWLNSSWRTVNMWDEDKGLIVNLSGREGSIIVKLLGTHSSIMGRDIFIPPATMKMR